MIEQLQVILLRLELFLGIGPLLPGHPRHPHHGIHRRHHPRRSPSPHGIGLLLLLLLFILLQLQSLLIHQQMLQLTHPKHDQKVERQPRHVPDIQVIHIDAVLHHPPKLLSQWEGHLREYKPREEIVHPGHLQHHRHSHPDRALHTREHHVLAVHHHLRHVGLWLVAALFEVALRATQVGAAGVEGLFREEHAGAGQSVAFREQFSELLTQHVLVGVVDEFLFAGDELLGGCELAVVRVEQFYDADGDSHVDHWQEDPVPDFGVEFDVHGYIYYQWPGGLWGIREIRTQKGYARRCGKLENVNCLDNHLISNASRNLIPAQPDIHLPLPTLQIPRIIIWRLLAIQMYKTLGPTLKDKKLRKQTQDQFDKVIQIEQTNHSTSKLGYLTNFKSATITDRSANEQRAGMLCYFVDENGTTFKATYKYSPYFYVAFIEGYEREVRMYIENKVPKYEEAVEVEKEDLEDPRHLSGVPRKYIKISFKTVNDLMAGRQPLKHMLETRKSKQGGNIARTIDAQNHYKILYDNNCKQVLDNGQFITGIRQYDIPYHSRLCIDRNIRAGKWYEMDVKGGIIENLKIREDMLTRPDLKVLAFDIETSKDPLKFPDAEKDVVMMISLMFDGEAYLIINLGFCGQNVESFKYDPKPEFACNVTVFNEESEKATLEKFFKLIQVYRPSVITSFNGDKFDLPFIKIRCDKLQLSFEAGCGLYLDSQGQFYGRYISHLDCYYWVDRDAYLPQGSHGLKAVSKAKLHYDPIQVDPQDMVDLARNCTQKLAEYSVSDAVATYFLYMKHIHDFIFALCTIIPMYPDEVLRKGSGTLCENLLMAAASERNIIFPNKKSEEFMKIVDGHRIDSETYTGGKVECLRTGVYRADFMTDFQLSPQTFQFLIDNLDNVLDFTIQHQTKQPKSSCINYESVKQSITNKLIALRDVKTPHRHMAHPLIYHLDVAAMYPNIILTNRLQPVSIVNQKICGNCIYVSQQGANCKRDLEWEWKGEVFPLNESEFVQVQNILDIEIRTKKDPEFCANQAEYQKELKKRVKMYCQKSYKKTHISRAEVRRDTVCMRENSFYVDTVRDFRDRRYKFKADVKTEKGKYEKYTKAGDHVNAEQSKNLMVLYQSLQLAHKIILNSFYGYVMRKGARWYSMETAAMVTYIGSNIISECKNFIEGRIGKPLQLDTDGIWLLLPKGFPENETLKFKTGETCHVSYPCSILNLFIYQKYLNNQYQVQDPKTKKYQTRTQMSIQFQIDGPYKAMFIPAAKQKQKTTQLDTTLHSTQLLKKRYVVYNFKNTISEFKGFEMKRRGELQIVKVFQGEIFQQYLQGSNLKECYEACAKVARDKVNVLLKKGANMSQDDIIQYLQESKVLSRDLSDYAEQKGVAVTSAKRLSQFLGSSSIKGKGICCYFIISEKPVGSPVTERAIPTSIFEADEAVQRQFLSKWLKEKIPDSEKIDIKKILDWDYYFERLSSTIQKMVCIPAVLQNLDNPLPQVPLPQWLSKKTFDQRFHKQSRINSFNLVQVPKHPVQQRKATQKLTKISKSVQRNTSHNHHLNSSKPAPKVNHYNMNTQFKNWLKAQRQIWMQSTIDTKHGGGGFSYDWHILQIVQTKTPGAFTVWYSSDNRIHSATLMLDRKYYVINRQAKRTNGKKAPREQGPADQITIDQKSFLKQQQYYDSFLCNQTYETHLPLQTSFIINTGNTCRVREKLSCYKQENLRPVFSDEYLKGYESELPIVYVIGVSYLGKFVWAVYNEKLSEYKFMFVKYQFSNKEKKEKESYYKIARGVLGVEGAGMEVGGCESNQQAMCMVNAYLMEFREMLRSSFLVAVRAEFSVRQLQMMGLGALCTETPCLSLPPATLSADCDNISSLDWKSRLLKFNIQQYRLSFPLLQSTIRQCRYSHIPLCNLLPHQSPNLNPLSPVNRHPQHQHLDTITNIMYSRVLRAGDHLLWWDEFNHQIATSYQSESYTGRINNPGLYTSYCIEFDMANLVLNAIAISEDQPEKAATAVYGEKVRKRGAKAETLDDMGKVSMALEHLRKLVREFIADVEKRQSEEGDLLLQNLYKWIITRSNSLYDPLLHRLIKELAKNMFYTFMLKIKEMGFKIIYANFQKLVISTQKYTFQQAINRTKYMLSKCLQDDKKKYGFLILNPTKAWRTLLFLDNYNYSGYIQSAQNQLQYEFRWDLTYNLSPKIGKALRSSIFIYLDRLKAIRDELLRELSGDYRELFNCLQDRMRDRMCEFIDKEYSAMFCEGVKQLMRSWEEEGRGEKMEVEEVTHGSQDEKEEQQEQEQEEEQDDSFIVEDDEFDIEGKGHKKQKRSHGKKISKKQQQLQWGKHHDIQKLIQNLFKLLKSQHQQINDHLQKLRSESLRLICFQPLIRTPTINPIYPIFQIPCPHCRHICESPGICQCGEPLTGISQDIENSVWKMMKEVGRDLWCESCGIGRGDFLRRHCQCGGRWVMKGDPLAWVPFVEKKGDEWQYVQTVLKFVGLEE